MRLVLLRIRDTTIGEKRAEGIFEEIRKNKKIEYGMNKIKNRYTFIIYEQ